MLDQALRSSHHIVTGCDDLVTIGRDRPGPDYSFLGVLWAASFSGDPKQTPTYSVRYDPSDSGDWVYWDGIPVQVGPPVPQPY